MDNSSALLLIAHGTRDPDGVEELVDLLGRVRQEMPGCPVEAGVLEFPNPRLPSVEEAVNRCLTESPRGLAVLPLLLHQAGHSQRDVPSQLRATLESFPGLRLSTCASLGVQPSLLDVIAERAHYAEQDLPPADPARTALLVVGRGSSDPGANADFFEVLPFLQQRTAYAWVEGCFVSLAEPYVAEGIERCLELGAQRVVVVPYFLSIGILVKRIGSQVVTAQANHPENDFATGTHIGAHPKLIQVLVEQANLLLSKLTLETEGIPA